MFSAQTVVIGDRVYCGGGTCTTIPSSVARGVFKYFSSSAAAAAAAAAADAAARECQVFCYSPSADTWNTLPACGVRHFGLGQVRGKLITVGGKKKSDGKDTNEVYEFDEETQSWKQSIPPMPTARRSPAVLSHHSTLIVAGGNIGTFDPTYTRAVELFREDTSQWYTTKPLPFRWITSASVLINNRWYLLGDETVSGPGVYFYDSNPAVCTHVDILLQKALPRDQASTDRDSTDKPAWEVLPDSPNCAQPAAHVYSPYINAWIHIMVSDLPAPKVRNATAMMLSPSEVLVIGGQNSQGIQNCVHKGLLQFE